MRGRRSSTAWLFRRAVTVPTGASLGSPTAPMAPAPTSSWISAAARPARARTTSSTFGSFVYFIADDCTHEEIWKTDGTTTTKATTLPAGASTAGIRTPTVSGSRPLFVYNDGPNRRLDVLDGTAAGAHAVPISPIPDGGTVITNQPRIHPTDVNGTLYFAQYDTQHGHRAVDIGRHDGDLH